MDGRSPSRRFHHRQNKPVRTTIDDIAADSPGRPFISICRSDEVSAGWQDITYSDFSKAVNRCAWWMKQAFGESQKFKTLSYAGPQDLTYLILLLASTKTGHNVSIPTHILLARRWFNDRPQILLCHPALSLEDRLILLEASHCEIFLHPVNDSSISQSVFQRLDMTIAALPQLDAWLVDSDVSPFPFRKTRIDAWNDPFAIVHSSGTTGTPKFLQLTHSSVAAAAGSWQSQDGRHSLFELWGGLRVLMTFPISLAVGVFCMLSTNIGFGWIVVLPPPVPRRPD